MSTEMLFHVELRADCDELRKAHTPPMPSDMTLASLASWADAGTAAETAKDQLIAKLIEPAFACIVGATELPRMLAECGDHAILRLSLERPVAAHQS